MDFGHLNDKQIEAVLHKDGPLLILAGAGSGKTSTMTHRIAYLIEQGVSPWSISAVTFTNKAAGEMRDRVEKLVGSTRGMWIMTFHAMCLRMLREHAERIGYNKDFVIYDTTDQKTVVRNGLKALNLDAKYLKPAYVLAVISSNKEQGISPRAFEEESESDYRSKALVNLYYHYERTLKENNAMDFDDLLVNAVQLLERERDILEDYQERFKYIMVDEYQDTNRVQYNLVSLLAKKYKNICVVGDDDQCIYQWRGADIRNILDFEKDFPDAKVIKLEQNYRSKGNILKAAHSVISNNIGRKSKKLWTEAEAGEKIYYFHGDDEKDEASFVAGEIHLMVNVQDQSEKEYKYSDFAILYRTNAQSRQFEEALTRKDIPYRVLSGLRYYDRKEIKDIMAYMRLVANPKDDLSLRRIINEPKRGIGDKTLEKLQALAGIRGESILESLGDSSVVDSLSGKSRELVKAMVDVINICKEEGNDLSVSEIYDRLLVGTGYLDALEKEQTVEAEGRIENLMEFKSVIQDYEQETAVEALKFNMSDGEAVNEEEFPPEPTISGFMEKISLMAEIDNHDENEDAVVLMTMHSSKGLEFPVVFLPGMEDGLFPGNRSFETPEGIEEERRLCYVGMTRAKERLFLTNAAVRTLYGRTEYTRESQFLREVDKSILAGHGVYENKRNYGRGLVAGPGVYTGPADGASSGAMNGYKPYDVLKQAKEATKKLGGRSVAAGSGSGGDSDFSVGDLVEHKKFGLGKVIESGDSFVKVAFEENIGIKKLAKGLAPIKKIEK